MPEAVIVAAARSPIGRAFKGSMTGFRPDDLAATIVRASAPANSGLCVSGHESELPLANRDTVSTPAETNTSPSPALIAWKAIRVVCTDDAQ